MANGDIRSALLDARNAAKRHDGDAYMEKITPLKIMIREKARTEGVSLEDALDRVRQLQEPVGLDLMRWQAALAEALEDGEVIDEQVPTIDAPRPTSRSKVPAWAKKLCDGGIRLEVPPLFVDDEYLRGMLALKGFLDLPLAKERQEGVCEVGYALSTEFTNRAHWSFGKVVVFGWRVDERKVHKGTLEAETERRCRHLIANEGYTRISKNHRKELKEQAKADLLRNAVPQRTIYPVAWCPTEGWMLVQGVPKVADAVRKEFKGKSFPLDGCLDRVVRHRLSMLGGCTRLDKPTSNAPTSSKMEDYPLAGAAWRDLMLWLLIKADQAQLMLEDAAVTWSPEGAIQVLNDGKITCPVDAGALVAALADGAIIEKLRFCITEQPPAPPVREDGEDSDGEIPSPIRWHLALTVKDDALEAVASLAPVTKKDLGDEDPLEAMVFERVELHRRFWALLEKMLIAFADARCNVWPGVWESGREWVGLKLSEHYAFDEKTGQGWLFAPKGEK